MSVTNKIYTLFNKHGKLKNVYYEDAYNLVESGKWHDSTSYGENEVRLGEILPLTGDSIPSVSAPPSTEKKVTKKVKSTKNASKSKNGK